MTTLKFVSWNMEWLNDLFVSEDEGHGQIAFKADTAQTQHGKDSRATVKTRRNQIKGVIEELDPDVLVVLEGPNLVGELQLLCDTDWTGTWKAFIQPSKGSAQNIGIVVRTDRDKFAAEPVTQFDSAVEPAFSEWRVDTDEDSVKEVYNFERLPLYTEIHPKEGNAFRILGLHLKSKGIFTALEWSQWWQLSEGNSRKILAETGRIRSAFLDTYLTTAATQNIPLIVCGDINDGPGMDASEKRLFGSGVERLMGSVWSPKLCMRNALFEKLDEDDQKALKFEKLATTNYADPIFNKVYHNEWIDHILYTPNVKQGWLTHPDIHLKLADGQKIWKKYPYSSDHYPVSVQLDTSV